MAGRVGLVLPSRGDTLVYEFYQVAPPGVLAVPYALNLKDLEEDEFKRVRSTYQQAVEQMNFEQVDVICVCGTPPLLSQGYEGYPSLAETLRASSDVPVVTGPQVEAEAMAACGVRAPTVVTPHEELLNDRLMAYLKEEGWDVKRVTGLGIRSAYEISLVHAADIYRHVIGVSRKTDGLGDGAHLTCPRWPTIEILRPMEQVLGVPCTSSAQAIIWATLGRLRVIEDGLAEGYGSLFSHPVPTD